MLQPFFKHCAGKGKNLLTATASFKKETGNFHNNKKVTRNLHNCAFESCTDKFQFQIMETQDYLRFVETNTQFFYRKQLNTK